MEFEKTFVTFSLGHVPFYKSTATSPASFLKVFSQDHLGKRLLLNHSANQWCTSIRPSVLYQLYLLRCQTEIIRCKEIGIIQSCAETRQRNMASGQMERAEDGTTPYHVAKKQCVLLPPLDMRAQKGIPFHVPWVHHL